MNFSNSNIIITPKDADGYYALVLGQVDAAVEFCRVAIEKSPGDVNMVALLGVTLMKSGALVEAEAMLRRAIQLAPRFAKPYRHLASGQPTHDRDAG